MSIIDTPYLEDFVGSPAILLGYGKNNTDNITGGIAAATSMIRSAAIRRGYTAESFDAVTVVDADADMKRVASQLALGVMTAGDAARPQNITDGWNEANKWLGLLAGGAITIIGLITTTAKIAHHHRGGDVFKRRPEDSQEFNNRDPYI